MAKLRNDIKSARHAAAAALEHASLVLQSQANQLDARLGNLESEGEDGSGWALEKDRSAKKYKLGDDDALEIQAQHKALEAQ